MAAIVTLTMNPALDTATTTDRVEPTHKLRCSVPRYDPGGGGINVARAVHALGGDAVAIFPVGGPARVEGSRRCPRDVDIVRFLAEAMRSIASITMKVLSRQPEFQAVPLIGDNGLALDPPDWRPTAEQWAISDEETTQIKRVKRQEWESCVPGATLGKQQIRQLRPPMSGGRRKTVGRTGSGIGRRWL